MSRTRNAYEHALQTATKNPTATTYGQLQVAALQLLLTPGGTSLLQRDTTRLGRSHPDITTVLQRVLDTQPGSGGAGDAVVGYSERLAVAEAARTRAQTAARTARETGNPTDAAAATAAERAWRKAEALAATPSRGDRYVIHTPGRTPFPVGTTGVVQATWTKPGERGVLRVLFRADDGREEWVNVNHVQRTV